MSNHFHVVVHIDRERAAQWNTYEVFQRWLRLLKEPVLVSRFLAGKAMSEAELVAVEEIAAVY